MIKVATFCLLSLIGFQASASPQICSTSSLSSETKVAYDLWKSSSTESPVRSMEASKARSWILKSKVECVYSEMGKEFPDHNTSMMPLFKSGQFRDAIAKLNILKAEMLASAKLDQVEMTCPKKNRSQGLENDILSDPCVIEKHPEILDTLLTTSAIFEVVSPKVLPVPPTDPAQMTFTWLKTNHVQMLFPQK